MERVKIEFTTGNAAFDRWLAGEIRRCLEAVAEKIYNGESGGPVRDSNGNTVGAWSITKED